MKRIKNFFKDYFAFLRCDEDPVEQETLLAEQRLIIKSNDEEQKEQHSEEEPVVSSGHIDESQGDYNKLLNNTIDIIKYYDKMSEQVHVSDVKIILDDVCEKLIESLVLSGCKAINEPNAVFDMSRHKVVPFQIVPDGTTYKNIIRQGVEYNGEVKILAIVELNEKKYEMSTL